METITYKAGKTEIIKEVTDLNCKELLNHLISIMIMLWHSNSNIVKAIEEWDESKYIL